MSLPQRFFTLQRRVEHKRELFIRHYNAALMYFDLFTEAEKEAEEILAHVEKQTAKKAANK